MKNVRIDGVFDFEIAKFLQELGVKNIGLDCFPLSLNFIQGHVLDKILGTLEFDRLFLNFYDEKPTIIQTISFELNKKFPQLSDKIFIETLYNEKKYSVLDLKQSVVWDYQTEIVYKKDLKFLHLNQNQLILNRIELQDLINLKNQLPETQLIMQINWEEKILIEFNKKLKTKLFSFNLGNGLMSGYRNVDLNLLNKVLDKVKVDIEKEFSQ